MPSLSTATLFVQMVRLTWADRHAAASMPVNKFMREKQVPVRREVLKLFNLEGCVSRYHQVKLLVDDVGALAAAIRQNGFNMRRLVVAAMTVEIVTLRKLQGQ